MDIAVDQPIIHPEQDTLGRLNAAKNFAQMVLALDSTQGVVVGVLGPWGFGKTSFLNLARSQIDGSKIHILEFNPWMFSGADQLVERFFAELSTQVKIYPGIAQIGGLLKDYGGALNGRVASSMKILGLIIERRKRASGGAVGELRSKIRKALEKIDEPIIVILDDIDRLTTAEIKSVFKLVRLTANFPNIIYVMAFDREHVEKALDEQGLEGRSYLDKILQVAIDLPAIPDQTLSGQLLDALNDVIADIESPLHLDNEAWDDIFFEIIRPLILNLRNVRRYAATVHGALTALNGQVAIADVLALEAVRLFLPNVFAKLQGAVNCLTNSDEDTVLRIGDSDQFKRQIDDLVKTDESHSSIIKSMIHRLFPAAQRHIGRIHYDSEWRKEWIRKRRVAHVDVLRCYLERLMGDGLLAFTDAEIAFIHMKDANEFEAHLRLLDKSRLQDVIESLVTFEDQFNPEHVVPSTVTLLNLLPEMPERQSSLLSIDSRSSVGRVTYRLLRCLENQVSVELAVRQILLCLKSLSAKMVLIWQVGYRNGSGHELVSDEFASVLEKEWFNEVRSTSSNDLAKEYYLYIICYRTKSDAVSSGESFAVDSDPELTLALLKSARSVVSSQSIESRTVHQSPKLDWEGLIKIYGDLATLKERVMALRETHPEGEEELLELAQCYVVGSLPDRDELL